MLTTEQKERWNAWIAALRSGAFIQGKNNLKVQTEDGFRHCCLGVACELAQAAGCPIEEDHDYSMHTFNGYGSVLPEAVRTWYGFTSDLPQVPYLDRKESLACMNDYLNMTFDQIADVLEAYVNEGDAPKE